MTVFDLYHTWNEQIVELRPRPEGSPLGPRHKARVNSPVQVTGAGGKWMLVGLVLSKSVHLGNIANRIPGSAQKTSTSRRLSRLMDNHKIRVRDWYEPIVRKVLSEIVACGGEVRLLVDGTKVGSGHQLLMVAGTACAGIACAGTACAGTACAGTEC